MQVQVQLHVQRSSMPSGYWSLYWGLERLEFDPGKPAEPSLRFTDQVIIRYATLSALKLTMESYNS